MTTTTTRRSTPVMRPRQRPTMRPEDEAKLADSSAELERTLAQADRCTADLQRFAADLDSERISMDGIVIDPVEDDDSLVIHVEESLRALGQG